MVAVLSTGSCWSGSPLLWYLCLAQIRSQGRKVPLGWEWGGGGGDVVSCWLMFVGLGKRPRQGILHTAHGAENWREIPLQSSWQPP